MVSINIARWVIASVSFFHSSFLLFSYRVAVMHTAGWYAACLLVRAVLVDDNFSHRVICSDEAFVDGDRYSHL